MACFRTGSTTPVRTAARRPAGEDLSVTTSPPPDRIDPLATDHRARHVLSIDLEPRTDLPPFQGPRWLPPGVRCTSVRAWLQTLPPSAAPYSHLILSGSTCSVLEDHPPVAPTIALVREAVALRIPVLGICYGHQLVARAVLGLDHVRRAAVPEMGWLPVRVRPDSHGLFSGLPDPFRVFVAHHDEVQDPPPGWQVVAETDLCPVHAVVAEELRILGFQFHPEMDLAVGNACFAADRVALTAAGFDVDRILAEARDDGSGAALLPRFLDYPWPP